MPNTLATPSPPPGSAVVVAPSILLRIVLPILLLIAVVAAGCTSTSTLADPGSSTSAAPTSAPRTATSGGSGTTSGSTPGSGTTAGTTGGTTGGTTDAGARFTKEEQEVADAYVAAMDAINQAAAYPPDPNHPALYATMTGAMLAHWEGKLREMQANGQAGRLPADSQWTVLVRSVTVDGDTAEVVACQVDDAQLYRTSDGSNVDSGIVTADQAGDLIRVEGGWKVSNRQTTQERIGAQSCIG